MHLLLVEQSFITSAAFQEIIKQAPENADFVSCNNTKTLLKVVDKIAPELVVIDFDMITGNLVGIIGTLEALRKKSKDTHIIAVINKGAYEKLHTAIALGIIDDYLVKPVFKDDIFARVRMAVKGKKKPVAEGRLRSPGDDRVRPGTTKEIADERRASFKEDLFAEKTASQKSPAVQPSFDDLKKSGLRAERGTTIGFDEILGEATIRPQTNLETRKDRGGKKITRGAKVEGPQKDQEIKPNRLADFVIRHYRLVFIIVAVLVILSLVAAQGITIKTEIHDLLPEDYPQVQGYQEINEHFASGALLIVTIEGTDPEKMINAAEALAAITEDSPEAMQYISSINLKLDRDFVARWGLMLQEAKELERSRIMFSNLNLLPLLSTVNNAIGAASLETDTGRPAAGSVGVDAAAAMLNRIENFFTIFHFYLENPEAATLESQGKALAEAYLLGDLYNFSDDRTMLTFNMTPNFDLTELDTAAALLAEMEQIADDVRRAYPDLVIGYTGDVAFQADKMGAMGFDMVVPALAALFMILLLFIFSFRQFRAILLIGLSLIVGIIFAYGFVGITIGEVTLLTSIMSVLLIGLGIDYGLQIMGNFYTYRQDGCEPAEALRNTYQKAGGGILLAAFTTAVAFFALTFTGTKAFVQFGLVMGSGIILCLLSMFFLLPALLYRFGVRDPKAGGLPNLNYNFLATLAGACNRHRKLVLAAFLLLTIVLLGAAYHLMEYDYDMMALMPKDSPSIHYYDRIIEEFDLVPYPSMAVANSIEEARELTEALEKEPLVARVASVARFLPSPNEQQSRLAAIKNIREMPPRYVEYQYTAADMEQVVHEIKRLEQNAALIRESTEPAGGASDHSVFQELAALIDSNPALLAQRFAALDRSLAKELDMLITDMAAVNREMTVEDLPESITSAYFDYARERNMVVIYPQGNVVDDVESMESYNEALAKISPGITGVTQIMVTWMEVATESTQKGLIYIFAAVLLFVLLSFRKIKQTVLAVSPLVLGMIWMLGIYPLLGMKINMINIIVIPLVIGIGIDFGIHLTHRFREEGEIATTYRYTGKAVFLSGLTTMIGFGALGLMGKFHAIASVGTLLFVGIASCLLATLVVLPALFGSAKVYERVRRGSSDLSEDCVNGLPLYMNFSENPHHPQMDDQKRRGTKDDRFQ